MKPHSNWSYDRYRPAIHGDDEIYVCQVIPKTDSIALFWKTDETGEFTVYFRFKGTAKEWQTRVTTEKKIVLSDLESETEYEFYVTSAAEHSAVGYARTGYAPGVTVNYLHFDDRKYAFSGQYLCTPSLLKHPDGYLLASMDLYKAQKPQNLTLIFRSDDNGESWYHYTELFPCFWGKLFLHNGEVYMLSTSTEYGDLLIGKSTDGGKNWREPTVLFRGSCQFNVPGWHKSAMPVIEHKGRLWTAIDYGSWVTKTHASALLSVPVGADLLDADNWSLTDPLPFDPDWKGAVKGDKRGFLEGNAVVLPDGGIANMLRYCTDTGTPNRGLIPILCGDCENPEKQLTFEKFVSFPGNLSKFDILYDGESGYYYSIINTVYSEKMLWARNLLSLVRSPDLEKWETVTDLLDETKVDWKKVAFQYVSFLIDGDDILFLSRTAMNGSASFHDTNYSTFHRIPNFRKF